MHTTNQPQWSEICYHVIDQVQQVHKEKTQKIK
jgi:hypothetical protein